MIFYEPRENFRIIFTENKDSDFDEVLSELGYTKKNGNLFKYATVQKGTFVKLDGTNITLGANKVSAKGKDTYVVDKSYPFKCGKKYTGKFISTLNAFGSNYDVNIDGRKFSGMFSTSMDGAVKDKNSAILYLGGNSSTNVITPELTRFIYKMRQDNGNLLAPILRKYITTLHFTGKNRKLITGYAHLSTYLQLIKSPDVKLLKSLRENDGSISGLTLGAGKEDFLVTATVKGARDRKLFIDLETPLKLSTPDGNNVNNPNPYVIFSTKPIKFNNENTPTFALSMGRQTIFVGIFIFEGDKYLSNLKGGMNLLKMW